MERLKPAPFYIFREFSSRSRYVIDDLFEPTFSTAKIGKITLISRCHVSLFVFYLDFFLLLFPLPRSTNQLYETLQGYLLEARIIESNLNRRTYRWLRPTDNSKLIKLSNVSENV